MILWALDERLRRFGELRRSLPGISEKVLAQQLRELEADGIVRRTVFEETPPRVEYELTKAGAELYSALEGLGDRATGACASSTSSPPTAKSSRGIRSWF
ncbi:helix-turn-helix domain-containing protein [Streptomyces sp. NPDC026589]|uniref:winged helix-turn-helix transcriptional regulator n=1 Tax=Streptomyces sp. NPDC026589 TaxID=3155609 RepID=UPI0033FEB3BC